MAEVAVNNLSFGAKLKAKAIELQYPKGSEKYLFYVRLAPDIQRLEGCTDEEILQLMRAQDVKRLPLIYIEFLRYFGRFGGDVFGMNKRITDTLLK